MTIFPPHTLTIPNGDNNMSNLDILPQSIREGLSPEMSLVTYEGLSTQLGEAQTDNDLLLPIHRSNNSGNNNFDVMFYNHDNFNERYEVYPHKINFTKDRSEFIVGKTHYNADIRSYIKEVKETYTLKLNKGVSSPLFVPHIEGVFLVLEPLDNTDHSDNPPLILDDEDDDLGGVSELSTNFENVIDTPDSEDYETFDISGHNQMIMKQFINSKKIIKEEEEEPFYDESLAKLFEPSSNPIHTCATREETMAFHEVDGTQQTSLIQFDQTNDPVYMARKQFLDENPNAGLSMDMFDYVSHGMIPPTQELLDLPDRDQTQLTDYFDNSLDYEVFDVEEDEELLHNQVYVAFEDSNIGVVDLVLQTSMPKSDYVSLELGGIDDDQEVLVRDIEVELTDEEADINIFDLSNLKTKPITEYIYDEYTLMWRRSYGMCKSEPRPKSMPKPSQKLEHGSKDWYDWAIFDCQCEGHLLWHTEKEIEENGKELSDKVWKQIDSRDIFYIKPEPPEELGRELKQWEWDYNIFEKPQPKSLLQQLSDDKRQLRAVELNELSNIMEDYADKNFNHRHYSEPVVHKNSVYVNGDKYTFTNIVSNYRSKPDSSLNRRKDNIITPKPTKLDLTSIKDKDWFRFERKGNELHIYDKSTPNVATKPNIDSHVPLYIHKIA